MIRLTKSQTHAIAFFVIVFISVLTYIPAVDNFFISDDFGLLAVIEAAMGSPRWFFESTTEFFRLMSYVYFTACYLLFGLSPEPYYWAGIALHAVVSVLVYFLVFRLTGSSLAGCTAGAFFAAYERHQEAVMWISAANETVLALNSLAFLLLWRRAADSKGSVALAAAHGAFALALFSKEAAVILAVMAVLQLLLLGYSLRAAMWRSSVLFVMLAGFAVLWAAASQRNFFLTDGHYAFGWHFVPVYARSFLRLATPLIPMLAAWMVMRRYGAPDPLHRRASLYFASLLVLAIAPYCFLTYLDHIPSRNSYLPSAGLAGLMGIFFASIYASARTDGLKRIFALAFGVIIFANVAYIWLRKEPQYRERAAPTLELIRVLTGEEIRAAQQFPVRVCRFPLDQWTFTEAVKRFTPFNADQVVLADDCNSQGSARLEWDDNTKRYDTNFGQPLPSSESAEPVAAKQ